MDRGQRCASSIVVQTTVSTVPTATQNGRAQSISEIQGQESGTVIP